MLGRKKTPDPQPDLTEEVPDTGGRKGRPTPRRADAEAANKRPLVPTDRGAARRKQREEFSKARQEQQEAMRTGDEAKMPFQHRGAARRYMRDYVDARWSPGEWFLPAAIIILLVLLAGNIVPQYIELIVTVILTAYVLVFLAIIDAVLLGFRVRRRARAKFGEDALGRGAMMYVIFRAFYLRRMRLPRPQVKRGQFPV